MEYLIIGLLLGAAIGFAIARKKYRVTPEPGAVSGGSGRTKEKDDK